MIPVSGLPPVQTVEPSKAAGQTTAGAGDFSAALQSAIAGVESSGAAARTSMEQFITGDSTDLHNVALASQKASLDFEMFLQVRNKVVSAYQEVMRMQL